jgi:hypothetical protein
VLAGVIEIEINAGGVTVSVADPLIVPDEAVIVVVPCAIAVDKPPLATVATERFDDVHVAVVVKFCVVPLL